MYSYLSHTSASSEGSLRRSRAVVRSVYFYAMVVMVIARNLDNW